MTGQSVGGGFSDRKSRGAAWLLPLLPVAIASLALSALVYYHVRGSTLGDSASALQLLVVGIYRTVGFVPSFLFFLLTLTWGSIWFLTGRIQDPGKRVLHLLGLTIVLAIWVNLQAGDGPVAPGRGTIGAWIAGRMLPLFGLLVSTLLVAPVALATLVLATDFFFYRYFEELGATRQRPAPVGSLAGELGVELAVTEQFKGLAERTREPMSAPVVASAAAVELDEPSTTSRRSLRAERAAREEFDWVAAHRAEEEASRAAFEADLAADEEEASEVDEAPAVVIVPPPREVQVEVEEPVEEQEAEQEEVAEPEAAESKEGVWAVEADEDEQEERDGPDEEGGPDVIPPPPRPGSVAVPEASETPGVSTDEQWSLDLQPTAESEERETQGSAESEVEPEEQEVTASAGEQDEEEPTVTIPRPEEPVRQRRLFRDPAVDEGLVQEAADLILESGRASATHLQRRLRIDYELAKELLGILAQRGVIELEAGATQGRIVSDGSSTG